MKDRKPNRLKDYDYSQGGCYFVTICTKDRTDHFGEIENGDMILNEYGKIAFNNWELISNHFEHLHLDAFVIMPNHVHGIIVITDNPVGVAYMRPLQKIDKTKMLLSKIIQQYKSSVKRDICKQFHKSFIWQRSFYDRIIRNEKEFYNIQEYIQNNPMQWEWDEENILCLEKT
jgi:putative transposase